MDIKAYKKQLKETVIIPMMEFAGEVEDCGFSKKDIKKCEALILQYLSALEKLQNPQNEEIMAQVETLVLALNQLNEDTDYCMIETMEREAICEIIQTSAVECGLTDPADDITEEWREW
ncbi:MAG: hypothetical protein IJA86_05225 [Clostridia bacterium]|nr:hypothetical protein [Clostridia bacterium]